MQSHIVVAYQPNVIHAGLFNEKVSCEGLTRTYIIGCVCVQQVLLMVRNFEKPKLRPHTGTTPRLPLFRAFLNLIEPLSI